MAKTATAPSTRNSPKNAEKNPVRSPKETPTDGPSVEDPPAGTTHRRIPGRRRLTEPPGLPLPGPAPRPGRPPPERQTRAPVPWLRRDRLPPGLRAGADGTTLARNRKPRPNP